MSEIQAGVMEFRPSLKMRFYQALGFRYSAYLVPPEDWETAIYTTHHVVTHWGLIDRLRILLSGRSEVMMRVETEGPVRIKNTSATAVVLAPDARPRP